VLACGHKHSKTLQAIDNFQPHLSPKLAEKRRRQEEPLHHLKIRQVFCEKKFEL